MSVRQLQDKFIVRLPDGMRARLKEAAAANGRSMNAEVILRLEASPEQRSLDDVLELLRSIDLRLRTLEAGR